jgi:FkbM family methyltransferase
MIVQDREISRIRKHVRKLLKLCSIPLRAVMMDRTYVVRRGLAKGLRRRGGIAFVPEFLFPLTAEESLLKAMNFDGQVIFDIGGYEGTFALFFARAAGTSGSVYVFEPNPQNVIRIERNTSLNELANVKVAPIGLSDFNGQGVLYFDPNVAGRGTIQTEGENRDPTMSAEVSLWRLDDYMEHHILPAPDFVKIDVEGHEICVLKGMSRLLDKTMPVLWVETHAEYLEDAAERTTYQSSLKEILAAHHYTVRHVETGKALDLEDPRAWLDGHWLCRSSRGQREET